MVSTDRLANRKKRGVTDDPLADTPTATPVTPALPSAPVTPKQPSAPSPTSTPATAPPGYGGFGAGAGAVTGRRGRPDQLDPNHLTGPPTDLDQMIEGFVRNQLGQKADTTEQERLIREETEAKLGRNLNDQRASMGRAGFGASGALAGLESDARTNAARQASEAILGARQQAAQDVYSRGLGAAGLDIQERQLATQEAHQKALDDALVAILGGQPPEQPPEQPPGPTPHGGAVRGGGTNRGTATLAEQFVGRTKSSTLAKASDPKDPNLPRSDEADASWGDPVYVSGMGGGPGTYVVYRKPDGTLVRVDGK